MSHIARSTDKKFTGTDIQRGEVQSAIFIGGNGGKIVVAVGIEQRVVDHRTGGDDAGDFPFNDAFGHEFGVFDLFGDSDFESGGDQFGQIIIQRVIGKSAHRHSLALGQGQFQNRTYSFSVFKKFLVKVAQPEKQYRIGRDRPFCLLILHHHRSEFLTVSLGHYFNPSESNSASTATDLP